MNQFTRLELEYIYYATITANYRDKTKKKIKKSDIDFAFENGITTSDVDNIIKSIMDKVGKHLD